MEPKHAALNLGHCALDPRTYAFKHAASWCAKYEPTPRRKAYLAAIEQLEKQGTLL